MIYIFDVDGTLTPSRQPADTTFAKFFEEFCRTHRVIIISGSDYAKIQEQLTPEILDACERVFGCSGNTCHIQGQLVYENNWTVPEEIREFLERELASNEYPIRTGNHIEQRPGMINFSVVGRNATAQQRKDYYEWSKQTNDRERLIARLLNDHPGYGIDATVGGQISIDIYPASYDKSQIVQYLNDTEVTFFGDQIREGGNDHTLADSLKNASGCKTISSFSAWIYPIVDWNETYDILRTIVKSENFLNHI